LQTLPAAQALGITPDLCMAIDYSPGIVQVFDRLDRDWAATIPFIYSTKVLPEVVERYPGPAIPMWTLGGLATFLMHDREPVLDAGGNVSVALLRLLAWCGAARVTLVGQDFAWSGERSHVAGHHAQRPVRAFDPARHVRLQNLHGEEIISTLSYISAQRDMEADIARLEMPVHNVTAAPAPAGAAVVGPAREPRRGCCARSPGRWTASGRLYRAGRPRPEPVFKPRAGSGSRPSARCKSAWGGLRQAGTRQNESARPWAIAHVPQADPLYTPSLQRNLTLPGWRA
jgi:hypothetical protein